VGVHRTASSLVVAALSIVIAASGASTAVGGDCWFDEEDGQLQCTDSGDGDSVNPGTDEPSPKVGKRYVYLTTRPDIGECYYWSNTEGGIDAWDPANDPAIINIVLRTPECPANAAVGSNAVAAAWAIFRSWSLDEPAISLQPRSRGITGLPTFLSTPTPASISHTEVLPDGRTLRVRAHVEYLAVIWGDGTIVRYQPSSADPFPSGAVTHTYRFKTCTEEYRASHPSGGLCHPTLDRYRITATFSWYGEYTTDGSWIELGSLNRSNGTDYLVDEARGVFVP
jgi:hypothetical protein